MKIIEENKAVRCEKCKTLIGFNKNEMKVGELGCMYIRCPKCKEKVWLDGEPGLKLTADNIKYPQHFHFPKDAKVIDNKEIQEAVERVAKYIGENDFYCTLAYGDTMVFGINDEESIEIFVVKNPASTVLFKEVEANF